MAEIGLNLPGRYVCLRFVEILLANAVWRIYIQIPIQIQMQLTN